MKRALFLALLALTVGLLPAAHARTQGEWQIVQSAGDVTVLVDGYQKVAVDPRASLDEGTIVTTGDNGRAVIRRGQEQIILQPRTRLELTSSSSSTARFMQSSGSALFRIGKQRAPHFQVDTPYLAAIVKGTVFTVSVSDTHADVSVTEGAVEVSSNSGSAVTLVKRGMNARVSETDERQIDLQDRAGTHRLVTSNEGGWGSGGMGGGSSSGGNSSPPTSSGPGAGALLRTGTDEGMTGRPSNLSGLRDGGLRLQLSGTPDRQAPRTPAAGEAGSDGSTAVVPDPSKDRSKALRQSLADEENSVGEITQKPEQMGTSLQNAASTVAGKMGATMRSITRHKPLKVPATIPWTELSFGLMALISLMIASHIRSLHARTRKLESIA